MPTNEMIRGPLLAISVSVLLLASPDAMGNGTPRLFDSTERASTNLVAFPKWNTVRNRAGEERKAPEQCPGTFTRRCHIKAWDDFLATLRGKDLMTQMKAVHVEMNRRRYIIDPINWGVDDYWASPLQFFRRQGDCEDYAITKFLSLRALGVPNSMMRIVVLQDLNLRIGHAVLVVYVDHRIYVLDNQIAGIVTADRIRHYKPFYSINETSWWLHRTG